MAARTIILSGIAVQILITIAYNAGMEWLFYPGLVFFGVLVAFAYSVSCPVCGRRQVLRGLSIFDLRLPGERCYSCGCSLKERKPGTGSAE